MRAMTAGPGKYDDVCTVARESTDASSVVLIVIDGNKGTGFSVQSDLDTLVRLPELLEELARQIRNDAYG